MTLGHCRLAHRFLLGRIQIDKDAPCAFQKALTDIGNCQAAGRAVEDASAKAVLKRGNGSGHGRWRETQPRSGLGKAAGVCDRNKHLQFVKAIHCSS